ncbi:MAG: hypothetical protein AVDCRST_MAG28-2295 [uncultured Rubrobacteraceae bacterium]|uniref:Uncharacterized protein n=1 Tax=uncultured Rubrobacteraceae bacterium TaxID=349277 RepID=A0A6J4QVQ9_9ACTN|nr:MAG: hypothetical protein AVDCRST_MAG28-2295 [uncultured Rubrobacteraceae bacterium]
METHLGGLFEGSSTLEGSEAGPAAGFDTSTLRMYRSSGAGCGRTMGE